MLCAVVAVLSVAAAAAADPPVPLWPNAFNATLYKTGAISPSGVGVWGKLYYDWTFTAPYGAMREDIYNAYEDPYTSQWQMNCSILFVSDMIWFIFPATRQCNLRSSSGIPSVNPAWLRRLNASFTAPSHFRGVPTYKYSMLDPDNSSHTMEYFALASNTAVPLRSTNQINDPGSTDYFDVLVGPQDAALFAVPEYCHFRRTPDGCG